MDIFLSNNDLLGLFLLSFLAATILPLGSEWFVIILLIQGHPTAPIVATATLGNFLGGCTTYALGYYGSTFLTTKVFRISNQDKGRAMGIYKKYGSWSLLFSWVPVVGDPLCLIAGSLKLHPAIFAIFVFIGKGARYSGLAYLTIKGIPAP